MASPKIRAKPLKTRIERIPQFQACSGFEISNRIILRDGSRGLNFEFKSFHSRSDLIELLVFQLKSPDVPLKIIEGLLGTFYEGARLPTEVGSSHSTLLDRNIQAKENGVGLNLNKYVTPAAAIGDPRLRALDKEVVSRRPRRSSQHTVSTQRPSVRTVPQSVQFHSQSLRQGRHLIEFGMRVSEPMHGIAGTVK